MDLAVFTPEELPHALRALWMVANANGSITEPEQQLFEFLAELHHAKVPELGPIALPDLEKGVRTPHARHRLVQLAVVTALVDADPTDAQHAQVRAIAEALGQEEKSLAYLYDVAHHRRAMVRFDIARRMLGGTFMGHTTGEKLHNFSKVIGAVTKLLPADPEVAWRYKQLGLLPEGTLGREYWRFSTSRKFGFPGEGGAIVERTVFHDFIHVLSGYDTTPEGELRQGAFQAGNRRDDGFVFLCFVLTQFHVGIKFAPIAETRVGAFQVPAVMEAIARGAACKKDLTDEWDFWADAPRLLTDLRKEWGIGALTHREVGVQADTTA